MGPFDPADFEIVYPGVYSRAGGGAGGGVLRREQGHRGQRRDRHRGARGRHSARRHSGSRPQARGHRGHGALQQRQVRPGQPAAERRGLRPLARATRTSWPCPATAPTTTPSWCPIRPTRGTPCWCRSSTTASPTTRPVYPGRHALPGQPTSAGSSTAPRRRAPSTGTSRWPRWGSVYNQRGEKVNDTTWRVTESLKIYKDGKRPEKMGFAEMWEAPDWMARPAHVYTDADWDFIKDVWAKEARRGRRAALLGGRQGRRPADVDRRRPHRRVAGSHRAVRHGHRGQPHPAQGDHGPGHLRDHGPRREGRRLPPARPRRLRAAPCRTA